MARGANDGAALGFGDDEHVVLRDGVPGVGVWTLAETGHPDHDLRLAAGRVGHRLRGYVRRRDRSPPDQRHPLQFRLVAEQADRRPERHATDRLGRRELHHGRAGPDRRGGRAHFSCRWYHRHRSRRAGGQLRRPERHPGV